MSTSNSHTDEMKIVKRMDVLRVRLDSVTSTRAERQEYVRLWRELEARLKVTASGPRERPASGQRDAREQAA